MDLRLSEEQELIRSSARNFLESECPMSLVRALETDPQGYSPDLWKKMADLGWMALAIPEEHGGVGLSFLDLSIIVEELGRARLQGPFHSTAVLCGLPIARFGTDAQKSRYLEGIATGDRIMAYAQSEPGAGWEPAGAGLVATAAGDNYILDGKKFLVPYAHVADDLLVVGRTSDSEAGDLTLFLMDARSQGISYERLDTIGGDHQYEITFDGVSIPRSDVLGQVNEGRAIVQAINQWGGAAKCAEIVGGAERVLEMTVEYAQQRTQFGKPIGTFQAVQHHCANMAIDVISSRHITYEAIWHVSEGLDGSEHVSIAKAWVSDAYQRVCALGHQVHGAVGFTSEHDLQLYFRHAKACELAFGDADYHRELLAQHLGL